MKCWNTCHVIRLFLGEGWTVSNMSDWLLIVCAVRLKLLLLIVVQLLSLVIQNRDLCFEHILNEHALFTQVDQISAWLTPDREISCRGDLFAELSTFVMHVALFECRCRAGFDLSLTWTRVFSLMLKFVSDACFKCILVLHWWVVDCVCFGFQQFVQHPFESNLSLLEFD